MRPAKAASLSRDVGCAMDSMRRPACEKRCRAKACHRSPRRFALAGRWGFLPRGSVLECSSPLELSVGLGTCESAGGPAQSKTLRAGEGAGASCHAAAFWSVPALWSFPWAWGVAKAPEDRRTPRRFALARAVEVFERWDGLCSCPDFRGCSLHPGVAHWGISGSIAGYAFCTRFSPFLCEPELGRSCFLPASCAAGGVSAAGGAADGAAGGVYAGD